MKRENILFIVIVIVVFILSFIYLILSNTLWKSNYLNVETKDYNNIIPYFSIDERVEYYLSALIEPKNIQIEIINEYPYEYTSFDETKDIYKTDFKTIKNKCNVNQKFPIITGDAMSITEHFVFTKTRFISNDKRLSKMVVLPIGIEKHFNFANKIFHGYDKELPWDKKSNKLVWRGATTGQDNSSYLHSRFRLVKKYFNQDWCDIAFNKICQEKNDYISFVRESIPEDELLNHKYLLSIEGNDVATNIKWMLASNSVILSPKFTMESWFMEGKLLPFVHYVPIDPSFNDLKQKYEWCVKNPKKCQEISKNATKFIECFMDQEVEDKVLCIVIDKVKEVMKYHSNSKS
jgi:hypothetical protein